MKKIDKELGIIEADQGRSDIAGPIITHQDYGDVNDAENDYKYQRENFYNLVERGNDAIEGILELAKEGEHPRAYELSLIHI